MARSFTWCSLGAFLLTCPGQARRVMVKDALEAAESEGVTLEEVAKEATSPSSEATDKFVCGALQSKFDACYPKKRDWGLGAWGKAEACTAQCQRKMGMCWCPNSGESCTSAGSHDPGFHLFNHNGHKVQWTVTEEGKSYAMEPLLKWPIKINKATREWQFLSEKQFFDKDKGQNVSSWSWQSPSSLGTSFLGPNAFAKFEHILKSNLAKSSDWQDWTVTEDGNAIPSGASNAEVTTTPTFDTASCDPEQIARLMKSHGL
mmetsp:Transcript_77623/g.128636  ORF Transcript_77623/g.128636 Transcript_77623/m.128636 type:complete len:260 (-) Transcript_77623:9-788(-)